MSEKAKPMVVTLLLLAGLGLSFGFGYAAGSVVAPEPGPGLDKIEEVWNIILSDYVVADEIDISRLAEGAIEGMVEALGDPYTSYLDASAYHLNLSDSEGKFSGIGAEVAIRDGQLTVIAPMAGSPAIEAGIRAGDIILEADGQPTSEMSLIEAVLNIRGPVGTSVRLLILHEGETEPVEIEVIRGEIELASVHFEMRGDVAYISISQFDERTNRELGPVLAALTEEAATAIILDLRHNLGGLLDAVVDVTSRFLTDGVIVIVRDSEGNHEVIEVSPQELTTDLPMVILVDGASASGSEVLAGALKDHGRATIAGSITFGKGSVNTLKALGDGSGLYITIARWLTPEGRLIEGKGIAPDYELELSGEEAIQWAIDYLHGSKPVG